MRKRQITALILVLVMLTTSVFSMTGCAAPEKENHMETVIFTDSCGREVEIPTEIDEIVPSGDLAQIILYTFDPELFLGFSTALTKVQKQFIDEKYWELPVFGKFYGSGSTVNYEEIIKADPDVIIDMGEFKEGIREDMDKLQADTGIPVLFIQANIDTMDEAYEALGKITGNIERGKTLSTYITDTIEEMEALASVIPESERKRVLYAQGEYATEVNAVGSIHSEILDIIGAVNVAELGELGKDTAKEVSMEQIMLWDPELLILAPDSCYEDIFDDEAWAGITAVKNGDVYEAPLGPYSWIDRPPSVQRILGMQWLGSIIYPEEFSYSIEERAQEFFQLFLHYDISDAELFAIMKNSVRIQ
ncbi:MAG: ABC transporter substrate-binding protein [Firmicutes bacterium]|nr:ABC transporter substrate-binding protein [Bacillota bacterium]